MREIKFRAWDKTNKVMEYNVNVNQDTAVKNGYQWYSIGNTVCDSKLMQYTGLKDKNGEEIYEGDIVVAWSAGHRAVGEVKQRIDGLWIMYPAYQKGELWGLCPNPKGETSVEVIGNIHDNPELLKEEQK